jgi:glc operon protein GlcG
MAITYGLPISLAEAKRVAAAAIAKAREQDWTMAAAIVDPGGHLVYFEKMDGTQTASARVAIDKACSAALFKRPTKAFQDMIAAGGEGLRAFGLRGAVAVEGGLPLIVNGAIVGAIGLSGGSSAQDGECAQAGVATLGSA